MACLGHIILGQGVAMDPEKIAAVAKWPTTKTVLALCGFLGLTGYSRKFMKDYGAIAAPLTKLTKEALVLGDNTNHALDALKAALTSVLLLQLPDFSQKLVVDCDASGSGFGAVSIRVTGR